MSIYRTLTQLIEKTYTYYLFKCLGYRTSIANLINIDCWIDIEAEKRKSLKKKSLRYLKKKKI